ncbi:MAG: hypothetical protein AB7O67_05225 [Vicinamibacterales bacterium]
MRRRTRQRLSAERDEALARGDSETADALALEIARLDSPASTALVAPGPPPPPVPGPVPRSRKLGGAIAATLAVALSVFSWWAGGREGRRSDPTPGTEPAPLIAIGSPYSEFLPGVSPVSPSDAVQPARTPAPRMAPPTRRPPPGTDSPRGGPGGPSDGRGATVRATAGEGAEPGADASRDRPTGSDSADTDEASGTAAAEQRIRETLRRYGAAYEALDADAAKRVWPSVNAADLSRAFAGLASQQLTFERCQVLDLGSATARASCVGEATYVLSSGPRNPRQERRRWTFDLARRGTSWVITRVDVRR